jgi:uncharacterized repeat protein (TIGR03803 family)
MACELRSAYPGALYEKKSACLSGLVFALLWLSAGSATEGALVFQKMVVFGSSDDGTQPGALIQGADGCLYGTTSGSRNPLLFTNGTVFKLTPQGEVAILASFDFNGTNGYHPSALVQTADRTFYGALQYGGTSPGNGAIFRLTPAGVLTTFFSFSGVNGRRPNILVRGSDGNLYGTTREGGGFGWGTVFKLTPAGELTSLFSFSRTNGINPTSLVRT